MLSQTLRDRIGGLLRGGTLDGPSAALDASAATWKGKGVAANGNGVAANGIGGAASGNGVAANGSRAGAPSSIAAAEPRRHFIATGIEEILPGGVIETAQGTVFAHERLYT